MKSRCESHDPSLLLLVHGALPILGQLGLYLHLMTCGDCRARLRDYQQTSSALARALGGASGRPRFVPPVTSYWRWLRISVGIVAVATLISWWLSSRPPSLQAATPSPTGASVVAPESECHSQIMPAAPASSLKSTPK